MKYIRLSFNILNEAKSSKNKNNNNIIKAGKSLIDVIEKYRFLYCSFFGEIYDNKLSDSRILVKPLCKDSLFNSGNAKEISYMLTSGKHHSELNRSSMRSDPDMYDKLIKDMQNADDEANTYKEFILNKYNEFEYMKVKSRGIFERSTLGRCNKMIYGVFNYYLSKVINYLTTNFEEEDFNTRLNSLLSKEAKNKEIIHTLFAHNYSYLGLSNVTQDEFYNEMNSYFATVKPRYAIDMKKRAGVSISYELTASSLEDIANEFIEFIEGVLNNAPEEFKRICLKNEEKNVSSSNNIVTGNTQSIYSEDDIRVCARNYYTFFNDLAEDICKAISPITHLSINVKREPEFIDDILNQLPNLGNLQNKGKCATSIKNELNRLSFAKGIRLIADKFQQDKLNYSCIYRSNEDSRDISLSYMYYSLIGSSKKIKDVSDLIGNPSTNKFSALLSLVYDSSIDSKTKRKAINEIKLYSDAAYTMMKIVWRILYEKYKNQFDEDTVAVCMTEAFTTAISRIYYCIIDVSSQIKNLSSNDYNNMLKKGLSLLEKIPSFKTIEESTPEKCCNKEFFNKLENDKSLDKYIDYAFNELKF